MNKELDLAKTWEQTPGGNVMLEGDGFYISYNSGVFMKMPFVGSDDGGSETALVKTGKKNPDFYILNGDFRKEYEKLVGAGFEKCLEFYNKMQDKGNASSWSKDAF